MASVPVARGIEKRIHTRFDKAFLVVIGSELYGDSVAIARNVSAGGILVEMTYAPPLGTVVTVHFQHHRGQDDAEVERDGFPPARGEAEIVARAEKVKAPPLPELPRRWARRVEDQASVRAIGMRFLEFVDPQAARSTPIACINGLTARALDR